MLFVIMVAATVFILRLLNWVPLSMESGGIRKYGTIDEVRRELKIRRILLPTYFPQHLSWPPAEIYAQSRPYPLVITYFKDENAGRIVLAISQAASKGSAVPPLRMRIEPCHVKREKTLIMKGKKARLSLADCRGGGVCNSMTWREGNYYMKVVDSGPEAELIRISESMISARDNTRPYLPAAEQGRTRIPPGTTK